MLTKRHHLLYLISIISFCIVLAGCGSTKAKKVPPAEVQQALSQVAS